MLQISTFLNSDVLSFKERASEAGTVALLGMATIFAVLAILWGAIELFHLCVFLAGKGKNKKQTKAVPAPVAAPEEPVAAPVDDGAVVAAITAAITQARAEEGNTTGFRVVSFRRVQ